MIDVGAGTLDVLYFDDTAGLHYKSVARSPVLYLAEKAARLRGDMLITGKEMGGGPITDILKRKAREVEVLMSASSARTLSHDPEKVRSWGIAVLDDERAEALKGDKRYSHLSIADIEIDRLKKIVRGFGVPFAFDVVVACAQDHGMPPAGVSHLDYRHNVFQARLDSNPHPDSLMYGSDEVPAAFNRLRSLAESAANLPAKEVYVMDSGMAAVLGASMDIQALGKKRILVLDVATSHTVGAALDEGEIVSMFEYHTRDLDLARLEGLLRDMANGSMDHEGILKEGGHGAYVRKPFGFNEAEAVVVTGPKRRLLETSRLPISFGAPLGDNMMTGTVGLLEAVRRRKKLGAITYI